MAIESMGEWPGKPVRSVPGDPHTLVATRVTLDKYTENGSIYYYVGLETGPKSRPTEVFARRVETFEDARTLVSELVA